MLPDYLSKAAPNPQKNRMPWYVEYRAYLCGDLLVDRVL